MSELSMPEDSYVSHGLTLHGYDWRASSAEQRKAAKTCKLYELLLPTVKKAGKWDLPEFQQVYFEDKRDFAGCIRSFLDVWIGQTRPHIVRGLDKEMVSYIKDHYHHGHPVWDALFHVYKTTRTATIQKIIKEITNVTTTQPYEVPIKRDGVVVSPGLVTLLPPKGPTKEGTVAYRQAMGAEEDEVHTIARRVFYDDMTGKEGHTFGGFFGNMVVLKPAPVPVVESEGEAGPGAAAATAIAAAAGSWVFEQVLPSEMQAMVKRRERCFEHHVTWPMLELTLIGIATQCKGQIELMDTNEKWLEKKHLGLLAGVVQCVMAVMGGTTIAKIAKSVDMAPRRHWLMMRKIIEEEMEGAWFKRLCQFKDVCLQGGVYVDRLHFSRRFRRDRRLDDLPPIDL